MSIIYDIDFEAGNLNEWTGVPGGGINNPTKFSATVGAALAGTGYGLAVLVDDTAMANGYHYPIGNSSGVMRARFYIDPNGVSIPTGGQINVFNFYNASVVAGYVALYYTTGSGYGIVGNAYDDAGSSRTIGINYALMDDSPHYIEVLLTRASTVDANNGIFQIWIDGTSIGSVTDVDNNARFNVFDWYYFGKNQATSGYSGTFYLDELVIRDDNTQIGAVGAGSSWSSSISPSPSAMDVVWDIDVEGGNLNEFGGQVGTDISASAGAALAGTNYGLAVLIDDVNTNYVYPSTLGSPLTNGVFRCRFYFHPNSITMGEASTITLLLLRYTSGALSVGVVQCYYSGSAYRILAGAYNDVSGRNDTASYVVTNAAHYIEVLWQRATGESTNDGSVTLWIDGVFKETKSGIDNYTTFANLDSFRFGAVTKVAGQSGTFFLDQFVANSDGGSIGAFSSFSASPSTSLSPSGSPSTSLSASPSRSASASPSASLSPSAEPPIDGSTCWGHVTGVIEENVRTFASNWTGTGTVTSSGDGEYIALSEGENMVSEVVYTGATMSIQLLQNVYDVSGDDATIEYRHGADVAACLAASWTTYSAPFSSLGYVQIRISN